MVFDVRGPLAPVFTPFDQDGRINYEVIPNYMAYLNQQRVGGILVGGTTGEAMTLNVSERKALLEAWIAAAKPFGTTIIAQVGGAPVPDVVELAKHAEHVKADAIMTLPELYYKPKTVDQLVGYLETVSEVAPTLPLIYYHFPMMTGVDVNMPQLFSDASSRIPNFKGMKADLGVAVQVADQLDKDQKVFIANHHLAPAVLMGHDSSIATVTNIFPDTVWKIIDAVKSGDVMKARVQQEMLNKLVDVITAQGDFVPAMKAAMEMVTGIEVGPSRGPLTNLDENQRICLKDNLQRLSIETALEFN